MGHPYWTPDQDMRSSCCGALSCAEIVDGQAICSRCGEHATFEREENICQTCGGSKKVPDYDKGTYHIYNWINNANVPQPMKDCPACMKEEEPLDFLTFAGLTKLLFPDCKLRGVNDGKTIAKHC